MSKVHKHLTLVVAALAAVSLSAADEPFVAFDNTLTPNQNLGYSSAFEFGDQLKLASGLPSGTYPVTDFQFEYRSGSAGTAVLRFYDMNGPVKNGFATPGNLLFETPSIPIAAGPGHSQALNFGANSPLAVPNDFTWTISFSGTSTGELLLYDGFQAGSSLSDFWHKDAGGEWVLATLDNGNIPANFAAKVTVVPEPSTLVLALLAGGGLLALRRRS
jgi:hypothetical protein